MRLAAGQFLGILPVWNKAVAFPYCTPAGRRSLVNWNGDTKGFDADNSILLSGRNANQLYQHTTWMEWMKIDFI